MIDINNLKFSKWSLQRKVESLRLMDECIRKQGSAVGRDTTGRFTHRSEERK